MSALSHTETLVERIRSLSQPIAAMPTGTAAQLEVLPGVRAVLFGMYGTLFLSATGSGSDQEGLSREILAEALRAAGLTGDVETAAGLGRDWFLEALRTERARRRDEGVEFPEADIRPLWLETLRRLAAENLLEQQPSEDDALRVAVECDFRANPAWPAPGMTETLAALRERGIRMGVVSNGQFFTPMLFPSLAEGTAEQLGFDRRLCVYSYEAGEAKPSLWLFDRALAALRDRHGILPTETLFVGCDVRTDLCPAEAAGCWTALFAGDARSLRTAENDPLCAHVQPDCVVTGLDQIIQCLEE